MGYCAAARAARPTEKSLHIGLARHVAGIALHQPVERLGRRNGVLGRRHDETG